MTRFNSKNTVIIITVFLLIISIFSPNISSNTVSNNNIALEESSEIKTSPLLFKIPVQAFSMSGFHNESNPDPWKGERRLVDGYFSKWVKDPEGYFREWYTDPTYSISHPTKEIVTSYISNPNCTFFYESSHGGPWGFGLNEIESYGYLDVRDSLKDRGPMPFTFLGSCHCLLQTGYNTISYEFTKGKTKGTVCIGYLYADNKMHLWQRKFFEVFNLGNKTVQEAFDAANDQYHLEESTGIVGDSSLTLNDIKEMLPQSSVASSRGINNMFREIFILFLQRFPILSKLFLNVSKIK